MHRFHLPPERWASGTLDRSESHHAANVLRLRAGDEVTVFDGSGRRALATITGASGTAVVLDVGEAEMTPPPAAAITLAQAVPKGKNIDLIVQKAVELGAARIVPLLTDRTVVQLDLAEAEKKRVKWQEIALEACKQCGQDHLPVVATPVKLSTFLAAGPADEFALVASLQPGARPLKNLLADFTSAHGRLPRSATVMIGPEGDFTPAEIDAALEHGARPMTLGRIVLRTETAAIYCLSVLAHELSAGD